MDDLVRRLMGGNQHNPGNRMEFIGSSVRKHYAFGESVEGPSVTPSPLPGEGEKKKGIVGDVAKGAGEADPEVGAAEDVGGLLFGGVKRRRERKEEKREAQTEQADATMQENDEANQSAIDAEQNQNNGDSRSGGA